MLKEYIKLLKGLFVLAVRNLLCKLGGVLLMVSVANVYAASVQPELPNELVLAISSAMQTHPDVMLANSKVLSAKSQVEAGDYRWYPKAEVAVRTGERGDRYSTVGLNQTLWDNGKINAEYEAAKASESVAFSGKNVTKRSVGMAAATAYLNVARAREQKVVAEENVNEHEKLYFSVLRRSGSGIGSKSDVSLAASRLQQARAMDGQWRGAVARAEAEYLSIIGVPVAIGVLPAIKSWAVVDEVDGLMARVVARSPSLQKLREEVRVAEATVIACSALLTRIRYR